MEFKFYSTHEFKNKLLWEETHALKVVGSNPSTVYWMDIFNIFIVKIVTFVWKYENKRRNGLFLLNNSSISVSASLP